jgi:hypothetical protein
VLLIGISNPTSPIREILSHVNEAFIFGFIIQASFEILAEFNPAFKQKISFLIV